MGINSGGRRQAPLEPPLPNQKRPKRARRRDVLIPRQTRIAQDISRVHPRLQTISAESAEPVHHLQARPLQRFWIERRFQRHESMRLDVFPELELRGAQEISDVGLHIRRRDGEHVGAQ